MYKGSHPSSKMNTPRETREQSQIEGPILEKLHQSKLRILSLLSSRLTITTLTHAFEKIRLLPLRREIIQKRMKRVIENVFKRQDYLSKWQAFQNLKRAAL